MMDDKNEESWRGQLLRTAVRTCITLISMQLTGKLQTDSYNFENFKQPLVYLKIIDYQSKH